MPLLLLALGVLSACTTEEKQPGLLERCEYEGWVFYDYQNVRIFHPPGHPIYSEFESITAGHVRALRSITSLLGQPMPTDTLIIVFYSGYESGRQITGREYPFVSKDIIHFWYPSYYGTTLMQWYLPRWVEIETSHLFLKHGLISLFDHSGQDYHAATLRFVDDNRFLRLGTLAIDQTINSDTERYQSAEAASFCAFVIALTPVPATAVACVGSIPVA